MKKYVTEFIGTFFLVLTVCLASGSLAPLAIGATLMVMVYMGGHISGGHYNPAVTLAVWMRGKCDTKDVVPYMVFQVLGALAASFVAWTITHRTFAPAPGEGVYWASALFVEILYTFALALVVLNVATAKATEGNSYYGLAIGFTIAAGAFAGGGISGGAFNPAVGTGPTLWNAFVGDGSLGNWWLYLAGPFLGGAAAALVFRFQHADD